jgi:hypothetical protein
LAFGSLKLGRISWIGPGVTPRANRCPLRAAQIDP